MSLEATLWAWDLDIQPVTKLVLLAIADYCGADQTAWPSYETISKRTRLDRRTIIRHCKKLEQLGLISIHKRKIKKDVNASNVYKLHV
jgi:DNA-binding MarR family transcriptional regulator